MNGVNNFPFAVTVSAPLGVALDSSGTVWINRNGGILRRTANSYLTNFVDGKNSNGRYDGGNIANVGMIVIGTDIYISSINGNRISKITPARVIYLSRLAGGGTDSNLPSNGFKDGTGAEAMFNNPRGLVADSSGNIYVADRLNHRIRMVTLAGVVSTMAGSGTVSSIDGTGTSATFNEPWGMAIDSDGNLLVTEVGSHKIRKITPAGVVATVAGTGSTGSADGAALSATFNYPRGIAVDRWGAIFVSDAGNHRIRMILGGQVSTIAGSTNGDADGYGSAAQFDSPRGLFVDTAGYPYVADYTNEKIRQIKVY